MTPRQRQVTQLAAQGLCNKRIASALGISVSTVKAHLYTARLAHPQVRTTINRPRTSHVPTIDAPAFASTFTDIPSFLELKA